MNSTTFDRVAASFAQGRSRRTVLKASLAGAAGLAGGFGGLASVSAQISTPVASPVAGDFAASITALAQTMLQERHLNAVIVRVLIDGAEVMTEAFGESQVGIPATKDMHFRNGAVAISYVSTLLLIFVDQKLVSLDDPLSKWLPALPDSDAVTLRMLANMTAGYPDYVPDAGFTAAAYADPFQQWTAEQLVAIGTGQPRLFAPGTNWDYSHTNYVILGRALERIGGAPLAELLKKHVLDPLGLNDTTAPGTAAITEPALHAFSSERRVALVVRQSSKAG